MNPVLRCCRARAFVLGCVVVLAGCISSPYEPLPSERLDGAPLSLVYIPSPEHVYVEIARGSRRYPEFEVHVGKRMLSQLAGSSLGVWMSHQYTLATAPQYATSLLDPVNLAIMVAQPLIDGAIEAHKQRRARKLAEPFNALIGSGEQGQQQLLTAIERRLQDDPGLDEISVRVLTEQDDEESYLQHLRDDLAIVFSSAAAFTPRFETLEVSIVYGLFDRTTSIDEPVYRNAVIVQSQVHAGRMGDTRDEIGTLLGAWVAAELAEIEADPGLSSTERVVTRNRVIRLSERRRRAYTRRYNPFDECDPEGELWLRDEGSAFRSALAEGYAEAARLMVADLRGGHGEPATDVEAPGYVEKIGRLPSLDQGQRMIYRLEKGPLLSLDAQSRMIPLSTD